MLLSVHSIALLWVCPSQRQHGPAYESLINLASYARNIMKPGQTFRKPTLSQVPIYSSIAN